MSYDELVNLKHPCSDCTIGDDGCKRICFYLFTYRNTYKKYMRKEYLYRGYISPKDDRKNRIRIGEKMTSLRSTTQYRSK